MCGSVDQTEIIHVHVSPVVTCSDCANSADCKRTYVGVILSNENYHFRCYYHLRSSVKRERFFAHVYFSNETVSQTTASTGPMKMFRLEHETINVCQRNVARFDHVECMSDKATVTTFFRVLEAWCHCDFRKMDALNVNKSGRTYRT